MGLQIKEELMYFFVYNNGILRKIATQILHIIYQIHSMYARYIYVLSITNKIIKNDEMNARTVLCTC